MDDLISWSHSRQRAVTRSFADVSFLIEIECSVGRAHLTQSTVSLYPAMVMPMIARFADPRPNLARRTV